MAVQTGRISIRGTVTEDGKDKSVTLATFTNLSLAKILPMINNADSLTGFLKKVQEVSSAKVSGTTFSFVPIYDAELIGEPGDKLDSSEIFNDDFSDTSIVPTLNMVNITDENKKVNYNVKYMADPIDTPNFETKVNALAEEMSNLCQDDIEFVSANLTFTAKDEVVKAE